MQAGQFSTATRVKANVDCKKSIGKKRHFYGCHLLSTKISKKAGIERFDSFYTLQGNKENQVPTSHSQAPLVQKETREQLGRLERRDHRVPKEKKDRMELGHQE